MSSIYNVTHKQDELNELIQKLKNFAVLNSMPMFLTCAVKNDDEETVYKTEILSPAGTNRVLTNNMFPDLVNVTNGASTYYITETSDQILDAIRTLPSENINGEYSEFTTSNIDEDDFYGED